MIYLEQLVDAIIAEEGQSLMGLDFLIDALNLPMQKIDLMFKKSLAEYSQRRPMKKTTVIYSYDYVNKDENAGYIQMPEGTTSCRIARYGVLPNQMPRFYMPKFSEQMVEFDPVTCTCKVWPPITPLRLTYTQDYVTTMNTVIEDKIYVPYETDEAYTVLASTPAGKSLVLQKPIIVKDPETGEPKEEILKMEATGYVNEREEAGELVQESILKGTLGTGTLNLRTRELTLELNDTSVAPIMISYYPKYSVVKELGIGHYVITKLFASKLIEALASLRAQATQEKLHNIDLTSDDLKERATTLREEVKDLMRQTLSYGDMAPQ